MSLLKIIRFIRSNQYHSARRLGDVQAVLQGRIVDRILQRKLGKLSRHAINKVLR